MGLPLRPAVVVAVTIVATAMLALALPRAASALERVRIGLTEDGAPLIGYYARPPGSDRVPAIVGLHGCSGLIRKGRISSLYTSWAEHLTASGYAVLLVDSAGSRGVGMTCGGNTQRRDMYRLRPADAYAALTHLQGRPGIDPARIGLIGWSQGGGVTLLTIAPHSVGRPDRPLRHDFRAAVAFYPGTCNARLQSRPYTAVPRGAWMPIAPLLVLQGGPDNWTPPGPCVDFITDIRRRGAPAEIIVYPNAVHAFDAPGLPLRARHDVHTARGAFPLVGTDEAARRDALVRVVAFFDANMPPG